MTTTTATPAPKRATWKGHGKPAEILWFGSIANNGTGIPATVAIEHDGNVVIRNSDGGQLDWCSPSGTFWAIPLPKPSIPTQAAPADSYGTPDPLAGLKAELNRALPHMADCQPDLSVCLCSDGEREQIIDALMPTISAHLTAATTAATAAEAAKAPF